MKTLFGLPLKFYKVFVPIQNIIPALLLICMVIMYGSVIIFVLYNQQNHREQEEEGVNNHQINNPIAEFV